jgi:hypothetical protein
MKKIQSAARIQEGIQNKIGRIEHGDRVKREYGATVFDIYEIINGKHYNEQDQKSEERHYLIFSDTVNKYRRERKE